MSRFTHINEEFICEHCGREVPPRQKSCRNHCPFCLHSKHVDVFPGDRASTCLGLMRPTSYELSGKKGLVLLFECLKCGVKTRNVSARDEGEFAKDDYDRILALTSLQP